MRLDRESEELIASRYCAGHTLAQVAADVGVSVKRVRKVLLAQDVTIRHRGVDRLPLPIEDMVEWYRAGESLAQIAERCSTSSSTVHQRLAERGVEMRRRGPNVGWYQARR